MKIAPTVAPTEAKAGDIAVVLLGAGRPHHGDAPSGLHETPDHRHVLDWIIESFSGLSPDWYFVGGFHVEEISEQYPNLNYAVNPEWQTTKAVESLFIAPITSESLHFVSYTDIVYSSDVVRKILATEGDVVLAVDSTWQTRFEGRTRSDIAIAEKLMLSGDKVVALGADLAIEDAGAEFAGLVKLTPKAMARVLALREDARPRFRDATLLDLFEYLMGEGHDIRAVDVGGNWAELNAPQDLARYVLGTKSETLERLRPLVQKSVIGEQVSFNVGRWAEDRDRLIGEIQSRFKDRLLAVRSSALSEDSWVTANAGAYLTLTNVPSSDAAGLASTIDRVIKSYGTESRDNQVLVQEMILAPVLSGVAFTRTLRTGAPYYVINYDDVSRRTDTVTSGLGQNLRVLVAHRACGDLDQKLGPHLSAVITALKELEGLVGHDSLDVEFAAAEDGTVHILQLRPIVAEHVPLHFSDQELDGLLGDAEVQLRGLRKAVPKVVGEKTMFGIMPDWNPAEMIGTSPRPLAASLYRHLVTDDIWAAQRGEYGYRDVRPHPLMTDFLGHPYIDLRTCFNSFIPAALDDGMAARLSDHYVERLTAHPQFHDKVEFEIVLASVDFDFDARTEHLRAAGFQPGEIDDLKGHLTQITYDAFGRIDDDLACLDNLDQSHRRIVDSGRAPLEKALDLLADCRQWGTRPFAHLARGAFVATSLLRSAVATGLIAEVDAGAFMQSLSTVARRLADDNEALLRNELPLDVFIDRYGHLRPGTYEITSPTYTDKAEQFLAPAPAKTVPGSAGRTLFSWPDGARTRVSSALSAIGLPDDFADFDAFVRKAIEGREHGKFVFSRSLSAALEYIADFGSEIGLPREQISYVTIDDLVAAAKGDTSGDVGQWLAEKSERGTRAHEIAQAVELPPLITGPDDFRVFHYPENQPNFVSLKKVTSSAVDLTHGIPEGDDLDGRILLIPQADPGFDWIFRYNIAGLITKYGGANSHMAIRAAEFGLPAAIGVGELAYARYRHSQTVELDCGGRQIKVIR